MSTARAHDGVRSRQRRGGDGRRRRLGVVAVLAALLICLLPSQAAAQVAGAAPVWIDIPSIGTHAEVVALGQDDDGTMQAPADPDTVGWYQLGTGIGAPGNVLLDGHVDWGGRLRVFGLLKELEPGDEIDLTDAEGNQLSYQVNWARLYEANSAPLDQIFEQSDAQEITLITCGGQFDSSTKMYLSRWVVRATRVSQVSPD